jgi:IS605 OrfB family transposase
MEPRYCCNGIISEAIKIVKRVEQIWLKATKSLPRLAHLAKNLYNEANYIIRQEFFKNGKWIRYYELDKLLKKSENYRALPAQTAQQILLLLDKSWKSFFEAIKEWKRNPATFKERPRPPRYKKKNGEHILVFTNQQAKLREGWLILPKLVGLKLKTRIAEGLREVRIIPRGVGYLLEIVYNKVLEVKKRDRSRIVGIDLGSTNIVTICNNIGEKPIIVKDDGSGIKSINQFYNKKKAELQAIYDRQGIKDGNKLKRLRAKRERKANDWLHKLSRFIVDWCVQHEIGKIVFGYNLGWKQEIELGKRNNQTFTQVPFVEIIEKVRYKAEEEGIEVELKEEAHTSKCSFLDNEPIEHREEYVGRRVKRGLFRSERWRLINADVNAAYNVIRLSDPEFSVHALKDGVGGCGLHPVRCIIDSIIRRDLRQNV